MSHRKCDNIVEKLPDGMYRHTCRICRRSSIEFTSKYVSSCREAPYLLGSMLAKWLRKIGLTRRRWTRWTAHYRMIGGMATCQLVRVPEEERTCGCGQRELLLNRWHAWLRKRFRPR